MDVIQFRNANLSSSDGDQWLAADYTVSAVDGAIRLVTTAISDPQFLQTHDDSRIVAIGANVPLLTIRMRRLEMPQNLTWEGNFFWTTTDPAEGSFVGGAGRSFTFPEPDWLGGSWVDITLDLSDEPLWTTRTIERLRFDFVHNATPLLSPSAIFEIDSISFPVDLGTPVLTPEDELARSAFGLLPRGVALPNSTDSEIGRVLRVTARSLARLEALADFVAEDFDPRITTGFLEDWERVLGLPECSNTLAPTTEGRRTEVLEKYTRTATLSLADLSAACLELGFPVTITENQPYAPGSDGSPTADAHIFDVQVTGGSLPISYFRAGESRSGDSLGAYGDERLVCLLNARKPAHLNYRLTV